MQYLNQLNNELRYTFESEGTKYERFKFDYEYIKLQIDYNTNSEGLSEFMNHYSLVVDKNYVKPYR